MIPKTLHQVWLGPKPIPERYLEFTRGWRALHPDWRYKLWRDEDVPLELLPLVDLASVPACRASVVRLHAILHHGGVYADMDTEWNRNMDELLGVTAFVCRTKRGHVSNSVFAAKAGHQMIAWQHERLPEHAGRRPPWGPALMTSAAERYADLVRVLPSEAFFPRDWDDPPASAREFPESFAVHHTDFSWKDAV